ncbi:CopG family ribbon-helix-helix protein [soil metagenome]
MADSATMTIRVSREVEQKLGQLAEETNRSKSHLAAEAVSLFVDRELDVVVGIQRALADVEAGRVTLHDEAMAEISAVIESVERRKG